MKLPFLILLSLVLMTGCANPDKTTYVLQNDGYSDINITGYKAFSCAEEDLYATGFTARKNGNFIIGTVCGGGGVGYTIRFD